MRSRIQTIRRCARRSHIVLLLVASAGFLGCQKHTKVLEQSVARADETSAIATLRTISLAQRTYSVSNDGNYGTFKQLYESDYLDSRFSSSSPELNGYVFTMNLGEKAYSCNADPVRSVGQQAGRHLYTDSSSSQIHVNANKPAAADDEILQF
jgi:hypothetical protein